MRNTQIPLFTPETEWVMPDSLKDLKGYKEILDKGPCATYEKLRMEYEIGNAQNYINAVLSPFVGNDFDPSQLSSYYGYGFRNGPNQFYS